MTSAKIEYIIMLIKLFARHFSLTFLEAYKYVSQYGGIDLKMKICKLWMYAR